MEYCSQRYFIPFLLLLFPSEMSDRSCSFAAVLARIDSKQGGHYLLLAGRPAFGGLPAAVIHMLVSRPSQF